MTRHAQAHHGFARGLAAAGRRAARLSVGCAVPDVWPFRVGEAAAAAGVVLSSLTQRGAALGDVFLELVDGSRTLGSAQKGARR